VFCVGCVWVLGWGVAVWIDGARRVSFGVPVRVEDHGEQLPGACRVLVGGRRWASLWWVENGAERGVILRLLL